jgi:hypothetical protein
MTEPSLTTDFARALSREKVEYIETLIADTPTKLRAIDLNTRSSTLAGNSLSVIHEESNSITLSNSRLASPESNYTRFNFLENPGHITQISNLPDPFVSKPILPKAKFMGQDFKPLPPLPHHLAGNLTLPLNEGGQPISGHQSANMDNEVILLQHYGSEFHRFHKPYQVEQHANPMPNYQDIPQSLPSITPVGQDPYTYQPSIVSQYQDLYMPQGQNCVALGQNYTALDQSYMPQAPYVNQGQKYIGPNQNYPSTSFNMAEFPQDQTYMDPSQNYPNTGFDLAEFPWGLPSQNLSLGVPSENQGCSPTNFNSHSSEGIESKTPSFSRGRGHSFQNRYQRGGGHDQRHHRSNELTGNQNDSQLHDRYYSHSNKAVDKSKDIPSTPDGYQRNGQSSTQPHSPEVFQGNELFNQVQSYSGPRDGAQVQAQSSTSSSFQGTDKPGDQHMQPYTSVSVRGEI